ncbi:hypothetical protein LENED_008870 [Lentinula edodes]|uniref:Uncharacterized protein n=1 Tax=Lentinula edodes TaxID=5353 RepID=A0A1Q3EIE5_LENED|nr:hypothetical protein LENED_008870 [Lentinula edodes]
MLKEDSAVEARGPWLVPGKLSIGSQPADSPCQDSTKHCGTEERAETSRKRYILKGKELNLKGIATISSVHTSHSNLVSVFASPSTALLVVQLSYCENWDDCGLFVHR